MSTPYLIVGLGNPGPKYATTRHNAGALALEYLADQWIGSVTWRQKFKGLFVEGNVCVNEHSLPVKFLFPQTFMNVSGESVQSAAKFYQIPLKNIIVLHDELEIPHAKLKMKQGGGNAGHNGLKSIDNHLGKDYWRVRLGIDHPRTFGGDKNSVSPYVLSNFTSQELQQFDDAIQVLPKALEQLLLGEVDAARQTLATA